MQTFSSERASLDGSACDAILLLYSYYQFINLGLDLSQKALQSTEPNWTSSTSFQGYLDD